MTSGGVVRTIPPGTLGFDCNVTLSQAQARWFWNMQYRFVCRYVPRRSKAPNDLSVQEIYNLHQSGLAVMPVQHAYPGHLLPHRALGLEYGITAATACQALGLQGLNVWLDLENVKPGTPAIDVIDFCNAWYDEVALAGFIPGVYVGWHCGLSSAMLYMSLKFRHYWGAYNLNHDEYPATRGIQMKQTPARVIDIPKGLHIDIDKDLVQRDKLGGLPIAYAPDEWAVGGPHSGSDKPSGHAHVHSSGALDGAPEGALDRLTGPA